MTLIENHVGLLWAGQVIRDLLLGKTRRASTCAMARTKQTGKQIYMIRNVP